MTIERRRVTYEGRVQGVGFRMTAARLASCFPVAGFIRNLADGRVEIVVEGAGPALAGFLGAVHREFAGGIERVHEVPESVGDAPLAGFSVRH